MIFVLVMLIVAVGGVLLGAWLWSIAGVPFLITVGKVCYRMGSKSKKLGEA